MSGFIQLNELEFFAYHGVSEQEKKVGNTFIIDFECKLDLSKASESDRLEDTISYADLFLLIKKEMEIPSNLLEHVAGRIIKSIRERYPQIQRIKISVAKINPPVGGQVTNAKIIIEN